MHRQSGKFVLGSAIVGLAIAGASVAYLDAARAPAPKMGSEVLQAPAASWDTFMADVAIRQSYQRGDGQPAPAPPAMSFQLRRWRTADGWKTTLALANMDRAIVRTPWSYQQLENPFLPSRVEYDGDDTPPRFYSATGALLPTPGEADRRVLNVPAAAADPIWGSTMALSAASKRPAVRTKSDWIDNVVATPEKRIARLAAFDAQFGQPIDSAYGVDRHRSSGGDLAYSILVDTTAGVLSEVDATRGGELVRRTTLTYEPGAYGLVRRLMRTEQFLPAPTGGQAVTDVELTNVRLIVWTGVRN